MKPLIKLKYSLDKKAASSGSHYFGLCAGRLHTSKGLARQGMTSFYVNLVFSHYFSIKIHAPGACWKVSLTRDHISCSDLTHFSSFKRPLKFAKRARLSVNCSQSSSEVNISDHVKFLSISGYLKRRRFVRQ